MTNYIKLATRKSPLALKQANTVKEYLIRNNVFEKIEIIPMRTSGDIVDSETFKKEGGKGLFLKELEKLLIESKADIAVHSMKDVPALIDSKFEVVSVMKREDPSDVFISKTYKSLSDIKYGTIGSSSPRRQAMIKHKNKNINTLEIRGNIHTRIDKIGMNKIDGIILAKAGLKRMDMQHLITEELSLDEFVPSPGQGVLCIEYLSNNMMVKKKLRKIMHSNTEICSAAERLFAANMNGNCLSPIGAFAVIKNNVLTLTGYVASLDGKKYIKNKISGKKEDSAQLANELSKVFIDMGSKKLLKC
tara:strand:+ start:1834 stop:2745 length:912 start_codon:yes stop_codon:yes gene_type:complete